MKTILRHILPAAMILLHISCAKEQEHPVPAQEKEMTFYGYAEDAVTKTSLNDDFSVSWQEGDAISILSGSGNSRFETSEISEDGKTASFTGPAHEAETYYAVYPYNKAAAMDGTSVYTEFPAIQNAFAGTFDPAAALTAAKTSGNTLHFMNAGAIAGFSVKGTGVASVTVSSADGMSPMAGEAEISFDGNVPVMTLSKTGGTNGITMNGPFAEGERYYFVVAPGTYNGLTLKFTNVQGQICSKSMTGKVSVGRCGNKWLGEFDIPDNAWKEKGSISAEWIAASSSTLTFSWGEGAGVKENYSHPYWFGLYRDHELTDMVVRYNSEKASEIWKDTRPAFTFGGLEKDTEYWFAVTDPVTLCTSEAIKAKTTDFTVVQPSEAEALPGAVILAEDFSEIPWNADEVNEAAGFRNTDISAFNAPYGDFPEGTFGERSSFESLLFYTNETSLGKAVSASRLAQWGATGQASAAANRKKVVFARPGYLKLGGYSYVSGIVTPAMSCIPEGKAAKVKLTFTASRYSKSDSRQMLISVASGQMEDHLFTVSSSHSSTITLKEEKGWDTYTVEFGNVTSDSHFIISPDSETEGTGNGKTQHRVFIDDITVEVTALKDAGYEMSIAAEAVAATSSTATVTWGEGDSGQHAYPYNFGLYKDAALTEPVAVYSAEAGDDVWNNKKPIFTFAGLDAGTTYYFAASDDLNMAKSGIIEVRTEDFTVIEPSGAVCTEGAVILAENFSELTYGGDGVNSAAGTDKYGVLCKQDKEELLWANDAMSGKRLEKWSAQCQAGDTRNVVLARPGYLKLGGWSYVADIVSPALECIPEGIRAKVRITFTASRYGSDSRNTIVSLVHGKETEGKRFTAESRIDSQLDIDTKAAWKTYSVEIDGALSDSRILIGPDAGKSGKGNGSSQHRMYIRDIKVEVIKLSKIGGIDAELAGATSSTLKFKWSKDGSAASYNEAYSFGLYRDQELTDPVKIYSSAVKAAAWSSKDPVFIFSGLEKGRTYYFCVSDAADTDCRSGVIEAATEEFTVITPENAQAVPGAVILAEDFSEFLYGGDGVNPDPAAGISGGVTLCNSGKDTGIDMTKSLKNWSLMCQRTTSNDNYTRPGYVKLGGGNYVSDLVTPELSCIPEGKQAKIRVTFSAAPYSTSETQSMISLIRVKSGSKQLFTKDETESEISKKTFNLEPVVEWKEYAFELDGAAGDSKILIGPDAETSGRGNGSSQHRMFLDNIRIEIISITDSTAEEQSSDKWQSTGR